MVIAVPQYKTEARRATLDQFAQLPEAMQTAFLQRTFAEPELRANPELLHAAMTETVIQQANKRELGALLQLSPQLAPTGRAHEMAQQAALENLTAQTANVKVEVQQAIERGETMQQIAARAKSSDNVTQSLVNETVREHAEGKQLTELKKADDAHREQVGLAQPEQAMNPFAAALANTGAAEALKAALGGHQQNPHSDVVAVTGGKSSPEQQNGRG